VCGGGPSNDDIAAACCITITVRGQKNTWAHAILGSSLDDDPEVPGSGSTAFRANRHGEAHRVGSFAPLRDSNCLIMSASE
jgi:hypothetical protein